VLDKQCTSSLTSVEEAAMFALSPKADLCGATSDVRFGPKADILCQTQYRYSIAASARSRIDCGISTPIASERVQDRKHRSE
jgi:hypothetical protein